MHILYINYSVMKQKKNNKRDAPDVPDQQDEQAIATMMRRYPAIDRPSAELYWMRKKKQKEYFADQTRSYRELFSLWQHWLHQWDIIRALSTKETMQYIGNPHALFEKMLKNKHYIP